MERAVFVFVVFYLSFENHGLTRLKRRTIQFDLDHWLAQAVETPANDQNRNQNAFIHHTPTG
jgi:hypothetical protein